MTALARFVLIVYDAVEQNWLGTFQPLTTLSPEQILDSMSFLDERQFKLVLLRTFPIECQVPNAHGRSFVTVMVVHESSWSLELEGRVVSASLNDLGLHSGFGGLMPDVPISVQFIWSSVCGACCEPSFLAPMSLVLPDIVGRMPPARLREFWLSLVRPYELH